MDPTVFREMFAYSFWANRQVWSCIEQLTEGQFTQDIAFSRGALRMQCIHIMGTESWWFHFLRTGEVAFLDAADYPTRAAVRAKWDEVEREVISYLAGVSDADLVRMVRPEVWDDEDQPVHAWQAMLQVAMHSTDHRAQTLASIHEMGGAGVEQDYLNYLDDQQRNNSATLHA